MNKLQALVSGIVLAVAAAYLLFFVEPASIYIVVLFIIVASSLTYVALSQLQVKKYQLLGTIFVFLQLTITYLVGFQIVNTILLISIIIGLYMLIDSFKKG